MMMSKSLESEMKEQISTTLLHMVVGGCVLELLNAHQRIKHTNIQLHEWMFELAIELGEV
jgi:hypothetical protein